MSSTVVVRGSGGALFERDVPTAGHALELWNEQLSKGELVIITDPVEWVEDAQGIRNLRLVAADAVEESDPGASSGRRGRRSAAVVEESPTPVEE